MKKLLIVTTVPETLSSFFLTFANYFRAKGWQVDAMAREVTSSPECVRAFNQVWDVEWSRNPLDPYNLVTAPQQVKAAVLKEKYDLVQVFTPVAAFVVRYALKDLRQQGYPKVIYCPLGFHFYIGGMPIKNAIFLVLEKLAGTWTDHLITINGEDRQAAEQHRIVPPKKLHYIPSGIGLDFERFNQQAVSEEEILKVRQELGLSQDNPLLLSVAEFIPRKRHRDLLRAFAQLNHSKVHMALAGDGKLMSEMQKLAIELNIQDRVHFLGLRRDIPVLMHASVATVLASEQEGLPICVIESLAMETPVIGTNIRGTRDLLENNSGLLVQLGDVQGLSQAMAWILEHPKAAREMGKNGLKYLKNYELQNVLNQYDDLYHIALQD